MTLGAKNTKQPRRTKAMPMEWQQSSKVISLTASAKTTPGVQSLSSGCRSTYAHHMAMMQDNATEQINTFEGQNIMMTH